MPKILKLAWLSSCIQCHSHFRFCGAFLALVWLAVGTAQAQSTNYVLGTTSLLVGPAAGTNSVVLGVTPATGSWTATANTNWLHLSLTNQSGTGSTNVIFTYDANPDSTRSGTLTIGDQTLIVTQAGATYVPAGQMTTLTAITVPGDSDQDQGLAVDGSGNVYFSDMYFNLIKEWSSANNTVTTLVSAHLKDAHLNEPKGVAVDSAGNVYIADTDNSAIKEWTVENSNVITLVSSGLLGPNGLALDGAGNVYIADTFNSAAKKWTAATSNVTTLVSSNLLDTADGIALDAAGNVYIAVWDSGATYEWSAAGSNLITLAPSNPLGTADAVAVDGAGNVYIADGQSHTIDKWMAASRNVTTLVSSGLGPHLPYYYLMDGPKGVAVDKSENVYILDTCNNAIKELPYTFVDPSPRFETPAAGYDALPVVLPSTANLQGPFTPSSDRPWLTITGATNGVVVFSFTANFGANRTAYITLLGQAIPITQNGFSYSLGTGALLEGPKAGSDSVVLAYTNIAKWTAAANDSWLHLSSVNQTGTGSKNVIFSYDANSGATRSGTLTIAGQTLFVTQAGSTYVAARPLTTLVASNRVTSLNNPNGVAVDGAGNVYIADTYDSATKEWTMMNGTVTTLEASDYNYPGGVAVDGEGNVYTADTDTNEINEWSVINQTGTTLVGSGLNYPNGVAVDGSGNVYIADTFTNEIQEWSAVTSNVTTLVTSGLSYPSGVAVDIAGNVYIADSDNQAIRKWVAANSNLTTLVSSETIYPAGVAVDGSGNVYIADSFGNAIDKWTAAKNTVTTLVAAGLNYPNGVAVDGAGNVYIADTDNNAIKEVPYAFVDQTAKLESASAGNDVLPVVLPVTENLLAPFSPTSDQSWLTITGITNGVVSFSFTANTGPARTANITLLGQTIPITQGVIGTSPTLSGAQALGNGVVQFIFTNTLSASFTVLSTTNLSLRLTNWTVVGAASNTTPGVFQFTSPPTTNDAQRFYSVRSP